jgi:hypothetical protein
MAFWANSEVPEEISAMRFSAAELRFVEWHACGLSFVVSSSYRGVITRDAHPLPVAAQYRHTSSQLRQPLPVQRRTPRPRNSPTPKQHHYADLHAPRVPPPRVPCRGIPRGRQEGCAAARKPHASAARRPPPLLLNLPPPPISSSPRFSSAVVVVNGPACGKTGKVTAPPLSPRRASRLAPRSPAPASPPLSTLDARRPA